jgi:RAB protein geranylgeranyltransferase component A
MDIRFRLNVIKDWFSELISEISGHLNKENTFTENDLILYENLKRKIVEKDDLMTYKNTIGAVYGSSDFLFRKYGPSEIYEMTTGFSFTEAKIYAKINNVIDLIQYYKSYITVLSEILLKLENKITVSKDIEIASVLKNIYIICLYGTDEKIFEDTRNVYFLHF